MKLEAYVIKNKDGKYINNSFVYDWTDNICEAYIDTDKSYMQMALERVRTIFNDGKLVKIIITEEKE